MRSLLAILLALVLGVFVGWMLCRGGCWSFTAGTNPSPIEIRLIKDSTYAYHIKPNRKIVGLNKMLKHSVVWIFDRDSTVASVNIDFTGASPFASAHFECGDSAAFSGLPVVAPGHTIYDYIVTVHPQAHAPVSVDPGIIIL